ncbi:DUF2034 domain-containing protein [Kineobactrum sediminis]|uniref:DUF2034 domain-containing protein n=1 Tax=Kineobactrum sediminis TaxID=1905677 RepID=A0A2N5Y4K9_9GAMM|nr:restriction endonuclease [Kineobactrum sediminis]PLW83336.1 DUF2034 domain-containing protein [Kineobactrum sediminis]
MIDLLLVAPWWWSPIAAVTVYVCLGTVLPATMPLDHPFFFALKSALPTLAWVFAIVLLIPAPFAYLNGRRKRAQLDNQTGLTSICLLPWKQFEELVAEAYYRKGYTVRENPNQGPDGGVDIWMERDGESHIVQCKQWKARKIGVPTVREMYGVMVSEGANSVSIVTSGSFTRDAKRFSEGKRIELVDGPKLANLVRDVRTNLGNIKDESGPHDPAPGLPATQTPGALKCALCGSDLVTRTAKKGANTGKQFLGCSSFPKCRYTRDA